jgi:type IV secretory pathway TraG/TraD family ATPase VirD4
LRRAIWKSSPHISHLLDDNSKRTAVAKMNNRTKDNAVGVFLLHLFASTQCVYWIVGLQQQHLVAAFSPQRPFQNYPAAASSNVVTWQQSHDVLASSYYPTKTNIFSSSESVATRANLFDDKQVR